MVKDHGIPEKDFIWIRNAFAFTEHAALLRNQETKLKTNSLEYREPNFEEEKTS